MEVGLVAVEANKVLPFESVRALNWLLVHSIYEGGDTGFASGNDFTMRHGKRKTTFFHRNWRIFEFDHTKKNTGYKIDAGFVALTMAHQDEFVEFVEHVNMTTKGCHSWDEGRYDKAVEQAKKRMFFYYN